MQLNKQWKMNINCNVLTSTRSITNRKDDEKPKRKKKIDPT